MAMMSAMALPMRMTAFMVRMFLPRLVNLMMATFLMMVLMVLVTLTVLALSAVMDVGAAPLVMRGLL